MFLKLGQREGNGTLNADATLYQIENAVAVNLSKPLPKHRSEPAQQKPFW